MNTMPYNVNDGLFYHFYQHARYGLSNDIPRFGQKKNWVEMFGDLGLWTLENFPGKVWKLMKEPRWITLALTQISLVGVTYLFYPKYSLDLAKNLLVKIALPTIEQAKFALYLTIVAHIVSAALRAYGRFRNDDLMNAWYSNGANQPVVVANQAVLVANDANATP